MTARAELSAADLALSRPASGANLRHSLLLCLLLALALHVAVILGLGFTAPEPSTPVQRSLDVTLATRPEATPDSADALAQSDQVGDQAEAEPRVDPGPEMDREPQTDPADAATDTVTEAAPEPLLDPGPAPRATEQPPTASGQSVRDLLLQQAESMTSIGPSTRFAPAENPRVRRISSASTRTAVEAAYINAWRNKVENLGNLNYPAEARQRRLEGDLRVLVEIDSSGTLLDARVLDSSGSQVLDEAALHIVRLAAPYLPFPEEMRREMDVLQIVRTWQFRRGMVDSGG